MHLTRRHVAAAWSTTTRTHEALRPALSAQLLPPLLLVAELCPKLLHRQHLSSRFAARLLHRNNYIAISSPEQNGYSSLCIKEELRRQRHHALHDVALYHAPANLALVVLAGTSSAVGQHHSGLARGLEVPEDVLEPRIVGIARRRRSESPAFVP